MTPDLSDDVASPIDLRAEKDAREWAATAMSSRPWRTAFFQEFVAELKRLEMRPLRILELGSGPGFLAQCALEAIPDASYTMLDFSEPMHELARERLGSHLSRTRQLLADFKDDNWVAALDRYDAIITHQAVHELRHKKHAVKLHQIARSVLDSDGVYLVCDLYVGGDGMHNEALYMTVEEQRSSLEAAGFTSVTKLLEMKGLVLHRAQHFVEITPHPDTPK